jgi:biopolymer transport protein ExbD
MAGSSSNEDNPVAINVIPMVDVIFCLCVFFMCSFKFKQLEGKFDSWLPKDKGASQPTPEDPKEIRIAMFWDDQTEKVRRQMGTRIVENDEEMLVLMRGAYEDWKAKGNEKVPVIIDGDERIPWKDVINVVNMAKGLQIENIEFALGKKD